MEQRWTTLLRGMTAAIWLVLLVLGLPYMLIEHVGWPLPTVVPDWGEVGRTLSTGAIEDATIVNALAVLVWLAWANFTVGVVLELVAIVRGRTAGRISGLRSGQRFAANLITSVSIAVATLSRPVATTAPDPVALRLAVATAPTPQPSITEHVGNPYQVAVVNGQAVGDVNTEDQAEPGTTYQVQQGDTFWDLAERFLGDGMRWREIRDLNVGRAQWDGYRLAADGEELRVGWDIRIPDAVARTAIGAETAGADVVVEGGDTLWRIADENLGDPMRWSDVFEINRGVTQPDGRELSDPDLILPGWKLQLPDDALGPSVAGDGDEVSDVATAPSGDDGPNGSVLAELDETAPTIPVDEAEDVRPDASVPGVEVGTPPTVADDPASSEPSPQQSETGQGSHDEDTEEESTVVTTAVAATLAAGLTFTLDRIRRARQRRREPGRRIPLPTGADGEIEQLLRLDADEDAATFLDLALRELAAHCESEDVLASVVYVSQGADDVAVHRETAVGAPPAGWRVEDDGSTWIRPRPAELTELAPYRGTLSCLPALVTLGTLPDGRTGFLNLGHARCLHLEGDPDRERDLLRAWALELATTPRADVLDVVAVGVDGLPEGLERLEVLDGHDDLGDRLDRQPSIGADAVPRMVVLATGLSAEVADGIRASTEVGQGSVAVVSGPSPQAGEWVLKVAGDDAQLHPTGIDVELLDLAPETLPTAIRLLEQALHDPDQLVPIPDLDDDEAAIELAHVEMAAPLPEPAVEVRVLGPVEIVGQAEPFRTNKTIELIVYLALHPSGSDTDTLMEALWPGREPRPARLYTEASRARKALGVARDGTPHLPDAELGKYRLSKAVGLDYENFRKHVAAARREPEVAANHLRQAITRIRGVPLSATSTEYAWATNETYRLAQELVDAAHDLAQLSLDAGNYDDATWAAEQGLLADPSAEVLVRDLMEAAAATGNTARVHAAMERLRRQITDDGDANDADDWLHPATIDTYDRLTRVAHT